MNICQRINSISNDFYIYLTRVFKYRLGMAEIGLTDIFLFAIIDYCHNKSLYNIKMYKTTWKTEAKYGNDIDLFIQRADGKYNRIALQAKVMSFNGAYKDLKLKSVPNQWDNLLTHESLFNSKSFYLFYNGQPLTKPIKTKATRSDCIGIPLINELGLGIVETKIVKTVRESLVSKTGQVYMRHFFPDYMDSIRKLFCCEDGGLNSDDLKGYDFDEIYTGAPYVEIKFSENQSIKEEEDEIAPADKAFSESKVNLPIEQHVDIAPVRILIYKPQLEQ